MAYSVSLADLSTRTLQRANLEGAAQFITPTELTSYLNGSIADWYDLVRLTTFGGQYYRGSATVTTTSTNTTGVYPLPFDFVSLLSVDCYLSPTWKVKARPFQEEDSCMFSGPNIPIGWTYTTPLYYQLQGSNIAFLPIPNGTYSVVLNFVPVPPTLNQPQDALDVISGWDEFIILDAAAKCLLKDGQLAVRAAILQEREVQRQRIINSAAERDQGGAEVIHDVVSNGGWFDNGGGMY